MSAKHSRKNSGTDWDRLERLTDAEIDTSEIPPLGPEFWDQAVLQLPVNKQCVTLRLDSDVLAWFKAQGKGYQTRINAILRTYMEARKKSA